jgi:nitrogen fixation NifU-like protein
MMSPKNYGVMEDANGVGMAVDKKTGEFTMIYLKIEDSIIKNITFGVNACQDTVVAGSLFTEMVKGDSLENGIKSMKLMDEKLFLVPKKQRICSSMVLEAFRSAIRNYENRQNGLDEDLFTFDLRDSCEGVNFE